MIVTGAPLIIKTLIGRQVSPHQGKADYLQDRYALPVLPILLVALAKRAVKAVWEAMMIQSRRRVETTVGGISAIN